ncbi:MAG: hypothetical protein ACR2P8_05705, partial [Myxococcota bacterium]
MRVWIDATGIDEDIQVFGMTLLERHLRVLSAARAAVERLPKAARKETSLPQVGACLEDLIGSRVSPTEVRIELRSGASLPEALPQELLERFPLAWSRSDEPAGRRLRAALEDADGEPVLALSADSLADPRLLGHLLWSDGTTAVVVGEGEERAAVMRIEGPLPESIEEATGLLEVAE